MYSTDDQKRRLSFYCSDRMSLFGEYKSTLKKTDLSVERYRCTDVISSPRCVAELTFLQFNTSFFS